VFVPCCCFLFLPRFWGLFVCDGDADDGVAVAVTVDRMDMLGVFCVGVKDVTDSGVV